MVELTQVLEMFSHRASLRYPIGLPRNQHSQQQNICQGTKSIRKSTRQAGLPVTASREYFGKKIKYN
mgnify:CR=1 FL=1